MPPKKKKRSELSDTAKYYRDNPAARRVKAKTDKSINSRDSQKKKRAESGRKRYAAQKSGKDVSEKDYDHGSNRFIDSSKNRGKKSGTAGDKRARGKK